MEFDYTQNLIRRSRLIMPANERKYVEKAHLRNADAVVLDLEDSVPVSEKVATRAVLRDSILLAGKSGSDVLVRVNNTNELLQGDVEAAVWPGLDGIFFPKVETGQQVRDLDRLLTELERKRGIPAGHVKISIIAETLKGYLNMQETTSASHRIDSLSLGTEDFATNTGMELSEATYHAWLIPRMQIVFVAHAYGKLPLNLLGSMAAFGDTAGFEKMAIHSYKHGFLGSSCIHPGNVEILNRCFSPTPEEIAYSQKLIDAFERSLAAGRASATLDGRMIDYPHYEKAKKILTRSAKIRALEQKKEKARKAATAG
ncbi:MAG: CoA ester lyase [Deltaproteobacteria bacterium]|nr:CoA ester lyase [Deltaproteobacteria bacterium]